MQNRKHKKVMMLTAATMLSSALLCSCAGSRTEKDRINKESYIKQDSVEGFIPTHPPVVINKTWREAMDEK